MYAFMGTASRILYYSGMLGKLPRRASCGHAAKDDNYIGINDHFKELVARAGRIAGGLTADANQLLGLDARPKDGDARNSAAHHRHFIATV